MKIFNLLIASLAFPVSSLALAQMGDMKSMDMHKDMHAPGKVTKSAQNPIVHHATGTIKSVDQEKRTVTLAHGPVKTLNWPGMTMSFGVKDDAMLEQFVPGSKAEVEFVKEGSKYVITSVK